MYTVFLFSDFVNIADHWQERDKIKSLKSFNGNSNNLDIWEGGSTRPKFFKNSLIKAHASNFFMVFCGIFFK